MAMHPSSPFAAPLVFLSVLCFATSEVFCHDDGNHWWDEFHGLSGCHKGQNASGLHTLKRYFHHFGYLNQGADYSDEFDDGLEEAIRTYQQNFHLNTTGIIDTPTVQQLIKPRCGVKDIVNGTSFSGRHVVKVGHSVAHFDFFRGNPRWSKSTLSYAFTTENQAFGRAELQAVFSSAFARWSAVSHFTFVETMDFQSADIKISFARGNHGDGDGRAFDGKLGTLAHAFAPENGMCHFDADETWAIDTAGLSSPSSIDLESVAVHEIGHLLGLGHSTVPNAIMFPAKASVHSATFFDIVHIAHPFPSLAPFFKFDSFWGPIARDRTSRNTYRRPYSAPSLPHRDRAYSLLPGSTDHSSSHPLSHLQSTVQSSNSSKGPLDMVASPA